MRTKKIALIGVGGVGGYFGFKISRNNEENKNNEITIVARGETYKALKEKGLVLLSVEQKIPTTRPHKLIENVFDIHEADLIIISVKEYDLKNICLQLKSIINEGTIILPLMNGIDIYERIRTIISNGIVLPSCVYVASHIKEIGVIEHKGNTGKIIIGKDPWHIDYEPKWVIEFLKESGIEVVYKENALSEIWTKFIFIASFGLVTARYNKSIGQVNEEPHLRTRASSIMKEIVTIAKKMGVHLDGDIVELSFQKASSFPYSTPTSLQLDVQSSKKNSELDLFAGSIIKYGRELNVSAPETERIYDEINKVVITVNGHTF